MKSLLYILYSLVFFSILYYNVVKYVGSKKDKANIKTYEDALYYTIVTQFTVGFGDIVPHSKIMRRITMLQILTVNGFLFYLLHNIQKNKNKNKNNKNNLLTNENENENELK